MRLFSKNSIIKNFNSKFSGIVFSLHYWSVREQRHWRISKFCSPWLTENWIQTTLRTRIFFSSRYFSHHSNYTDHLNFFAVVCRQLFEVMTEKMAEFDKNTIFDVWYNGVIYFRFPFFISGWWFAIIQDHHLFAENNQKDEVYYVCRNTFSVLFIFFDDFEYGGMNRFLLHPPCSE